MTNHYPRRKPRRKKAGLGPTPGSDSQKKATEDLIREFSNLTAEQKELIRKMGFTAANLGERNEEIRSAAEETILKLREEMAAQITRSDLSWGSKSSVWDAFDSPEAQQLRPQINRIVLDILDRALNSMELWIDNTDWNKHGISELRKGMQLEIENSEDLLKSNLQLEPVVQQKSDMSPKAQEFLNEFENTRVNPET